jgi:hypothetical protein
MKHTNTFAVRPLTDDNERVLRDLLDASAALWNEINYQRLMRYNDEDGFEGDVWDADTGALEGKYKGVRGAEDVIACRPRQSSPFINPPFRPSLALFPNSFISLHNYLVAQPRQQGPVLVR